MLTYIGLYFLIGIVLIGLLRLNQKPKVQLSILLGLVLIWPIVLGFLVIEVLKKVEI